MKKYFEQLRPLERRLVIGVGVMLVLVLNYVYVWPHFSDWSNLSNRKRNAESTLKHYQDTIARTPELQKQAAMYETKGEFVQPEDQSITLMQTIQHQSAASGVQLQGFSHSTSRTNDMFFVQQVQNITTVSPEDALVDFLYKLGANSSMIRVLDLSLQPDPPHQRLIADIQLVASYQKSPAGPAGQNATAKAK